MQVEWVPQQQSKCLVQLSDDPVPVLTKFQMINSAWSKTLEVKLQDLESVSCMKIDSQSKYVLVGTKTGLIQIIYLHTLQPANEPLAVSSYGINNLDTFYVPGLPELNVVAALSSGQVVMY